MVARWNHRVSTPAPLYPIGQPVQKAKGGRPKPAAFRVLNQIALWLGAPDQRTVIVDGDFGPVSVAGLGRIERVVVGLRVARPVALVEAGLHLGGAADGQRAGPGGEADFLVGIGVGARRAEL